MRLSKYIRGILSGEEYDKDTQESIIWDLHKNLSSPQDQFSFLDENSGDYQKNEQHIDYDEALFLAKKYFKNANTTWSECVYRGMWLSLDSIRKIYSEWLLLSKTEDEEHEDLCFTDQNAYFSGKSIQRATQANPDQLSFVFQIPIALLQEYNLEFYGWWDKFVVTQDIPVDIIKQCSVFVINYTTKDLILIKPLIPNGKGKQY